MYVMSGCELGRKEWGEKPAKVAAAPDYDCCEEIHAYVCASSVPEKECVE